MPEVKVFHSYDKAKSYFLEQLGDYFLSVLADNITTTTSDGNINYGVVNKTELGASLLCDENCFFEDANNFLKSLPADEKSFIKNSEGLVYLKLGYWLYSIQLVEEVS